MGSVAPPPADAVARLLRPRSVAIVGASDKPGSLGASVLANLERQRFPGAIHLVNPKRDMIGDRPCVASVDALPTGIDAVVLAIPRAAVLDTVRALAARSAGAVVIFSAGFAEGGAEGLAEQEEIARIGREAGMVIEGPNCLGMVNFVDGIPLTFVELPGTRLEGRPGVAVVSQSGAMAAVLGVTLLTRGIGLSFSVSTGNEAGSGVEDFARHLIDDPDTRVLAMIVEHFRDPPGFLRVAAQAREAGKPIVLLHPGRSSAARLSAATHTGALAGDHAVMSTQVRHAGVLLVDTIEELGDVAEILLRCPSMPVPGALVVGESGAFKALTLDLAEQVGLALPTFADADSPALRAALPPFVPVSNPLDLTAQGLSEPDLYRHTVRAALDDPRCGALLISLIQTDATTSDIKFPPVLAALGDEPPGKPVLVTGLDEGVAPVAHVAALRARGVPYFPTAERALRALARIARWSRRGSVAAAVPAGGAPLMLPVEDGIVAEHRSKALLEPIGLSFPPRRLVRTFEEAAEAAAALGYPVVLKAQAAALPHKTEAGGVIVGAADQAALSEDWTRLHANLARHRPGLVLDGVLVEAMSGRGVEMMIGARRDPDWGPIVLVGFGGVQAELLGDVRLLPPGLSRDAVREEIDQLRGAPLLRGFRGAAPADVDALIEIVLRLGAAVAAEPRIAEVDLNPVVLQSSGQGAVVLDALISLRSLV